MRTRVVIGLAVAAMATVAPGGQALSEELDLSGTWTLSGTDEKGLSVECPMAVPGDTHDALFAAGIIPDPFWGCNETNVQWVGRHDWTVARAFDVPDEEFLRPVDREFAHQLRRSGSWR